MGGFGVFGGGGEGRRGVPGGNGVVGVGTAAGGGDGVGVFGFSGGNASGVVGISDRAGGHAGVAGFNSAKQNVASYPKSVAVRLGNKGPYRRLYSMESPESWFEDFGEASLRRGRASVRISADFAPFIHTKDYHVFITPYGECGGLFVASRTRTAFEVRELNGGRNSIRFSYRIVAKRKDIKGMRLEKVEPPDQLKTVRAEPTRVRAERDDPIRNLRIPNLPGRRRRTD